MLFTLRPLGIATMLGLLAYMIEPGWMAWSSVPSARMAAMGGSRSWHVCGRPAHLDGPEPRKESDGYCRHTASSHARLRWSVSLGAPPVL